MQKKYMKFKIQSAINIVPFLDVLLILLIIFMMIPFQLIQGLHIHIPNNTETANITDNKYLVTIEILETGLYNFISNNNQIRNIYLQQLSTQIINEIDMHTNIVCLIAASKNIQYEEVIKILALLSNIGIRSVGMIINSIN